MLTVLGVALAGALGAPTRYVVDRAVTSRATGLLPRGTLLVNVTGSFVLGVVTGLVLYHGLARAPATVVGAGFLGAYTTFSTYAYETRALVETRAYGAAAWNLVLHAALPGLAAAAGLAVTAL